jgi:hypothetical protein
VLAPEASRRSPVAREISTFDDETFRQHRVGDLLNRALAEELRRRGAAPAAYPAR